ncbi:MAG: peptidylprolyl isomerase [Bacteroidetes bacterium]|nr:MAG: peptidylprolyl isomerase [Bacteroidota bacterium]PIE87626.1 MAG: peptidylprolyl isomerase [Bacteroidota bacterium]
MKSKSLFFLFLIMSFIMTTQAQEEKRTKVEITTSMGKMVVELYNETPIHRDNFIKLVKEGFYDQSEFHRIIKEFMIQGGGHNGGMKDAGYTIEAEIIPGVMHKRGALAAARKGDQVNPEKRSSGSQFYIVDGRKFSEGELQMLGQRMGKPFDKAQIEVYTTLGGAPHLDGGYTVFGELVEGFDVLDKIAAVETGRMDKPHKAVTMKARIIE